MMGRPTVFDDVEVRGELKAGALAAGGVRMIDFNDVEYSSTKYYLGGEELAEGLYIHSGDAITGTNCVIPNGARIVIMNAGMRTADINAGSTYCFAEAGAGTTFVAKKFTPGT